MNPPYGTIIYENQKDANAESRIHETAFLEKGVHLRESAMVRVKKTVWRDPSSTIRGVSP
jgi:hypothetical protein